MFLTVSSEQSEREGCCEYKRTYCKFPKYSDTPKICCNHSKIWTMWLYHRVSANDVDGMANSGCALFAQACLSENLGSLRYHCWIYLDQNYEIPWLFPDFLSIQNFPDHFPKFPDFSPPLTKNWLFPDQWPPLLNSEDTWSPCSNIFA